MTLKTSAPGNVFFFGEHSVVYERPAILAAVNKRTYSEIKKVNGNHISVKSEGYGEIDSNLSSLKEKKYKSYEDYTSQMDPIRDLIGILLEKFNLASGFELEIASEIPHSSGGMSSSTAVLASVLKAISELFQWEVPEEDYFELLYPLQVKIHGGSASGSEITSSSMGGYNEFVLDKSGEETEFNFENLGKQSYNLVIGDSRIEAKTGETVPYVKNGWENHSESYEKAFDEIEQIVKKGKEALIKGKAKEVGQLMDQNQELLRTLGVSHPKLEKMIKEARQSGAYGAKLSGGGKGGIMISLVPEGKENQVAKSIEEAGGKAFTTEVGVAGAKLEG